MVLTTTIVNLFAVVLWCCCMVGFVRPEYDQTPWRRKQQEETFKQRAKQQFHYNEDTERFEYRRPYWDIPDDGSLKPTIKWGQDEYNVYLTISVPGGGILDEYIEVTNDRRGHVHFECLGGVNNDQYKLDLHLFGKVDHRAANWLIDKTGTYYEMLLPKIPLKSGRKLWHRLENMIYPNPNITFDDRFDMFELLDWVNETIEVKSPHKLEIEPGPGENATYEQARNYFKEKFKKKGQKLHAFGAKDLQNPDKDSKNGDETVEAEDDDTVEGEGIGKGLNKKLRTRDEEEILKEEEDDVDFEETLLRQHARKRFSTP